MEFAPQEFLNKLKHGLELPRLVAVVGEEIYFRQKVMNALTEMVFDGVEQSDREIHRFESDTDFQAVEQAVNSYPFFCGKSLVVIADEKLFEVKGKSSEDGLAKRLEPYLQLVENLPEYCTFVFNVPKFNKLLKLYKYIRDNGAAVIGEPIRSDKLSPWLRECAESYGGSFDGTGIRQIMEYLAPTNFAPLSLLEREIEKLKLLRGTETPWTDKDVEQVFSDLPELGAFKLADAVTSRQLENALRFLRVEQKRPNSESVAITGMLRYKLRMIIRVMEYAAAGLSLKRMEERFTDIKNPSWQLRQAALVKGFDMEKLMWAYRELGQVDRTARTLGWSKERCFDRIEEIIVGLLTKSSYN